MRLLGLLGGGANTGLPSGYLAAEFLESTGTQCINTGIAVSSQAYFELDAQYIGEASKQGGGSGAGYILCADYPYDSTKPSLGITYFINGGNDIRFVSLNVVQSLIKPYSTERFKVGYDGKSGELSLNGSFVRNVKLTYTGKTLNALGLFATNRSGSMSTFTAVNKVIGRAFALTLGDEDRHIELVPVLDNQGVPCMYDKVTRKPLYNSGTGQFIVGMNMVQARKLGKLPSTGGTLTVSLPSNYQEDEGVVNALATAQENGWKITIQTYEAEAGAASTFALRRVWVRKRTDEQGSYVDSDGTRWQVEWCVDIVGADPEQEGYEPFRSVEVATEYWGLTAWIDPEQEELLTNTEEA
jgi:hypothetical protein